MVNYILIACSFKIYAASCLINTFKRFSILFNTNSHYWCREAVICRKQGLKGRFMPEFHDQETLKDFQYINSFVVICRKLFEDHSHCCCDQTCDLIEDLTSAFSSENRTFDGKSFEVSLTWSCQHIPSNV